MKGLRTTAKVVFANPETGVLLKNVIDLLHCAFIEILRILLIIRVLFDNRGGAFSVAVKVQLARHDWIVIAVVAKLVHLYKYFYCDITFKCKKESNLRD